MFPNVSVYMLDLQSKSHEAELRLRKERKPEVPLLSPPVVDLEENYFQAASSKSSFPNIGDASELTQALAQDLYNHISFPSLSMSSSKFFNFVTMYKSFFNNTIPSGKVM